MAITREPSLRIRAPWMKWANSLNIENNGSSNGGSSSSNNSGNDNSSSNNNPEIIHLGGSRIDMPEEFSREAEEFRRTMLAKARAAAAASSSGNIGPNTNGSLPGSPAEVKSLKSWGNVTPVSETAAEISPALLSSTWDLRPAPLRTPSDIMTGTNKAQPPTPQQQPQPFPQQFPQQFPHSQLSTTTMTSQTPPKPRTPQPQRTHNFQTPRLSARSASIDAVPSEVAAIRRSLLLSTTDLRKSNSTRSKISHIGSAISNTLGSVSGRVQKKTLPPRAPIVEVAEEEEEYEERPGSLEEVDEEEERRKEALQMRRPRTAGDREGPTHGYSLSHSHGRAPSRTHIAQLSLFPRDTTVFPRPPTAPLPATMRSSAAAAALVSRDPLGLRPSSAPHQQGEPHHHQQQQQQQHQSYLLQPPPYPPPSQPPPPPPPQQHLLHPQTRYQNQHQQQHQQKTNRSSPRYTAQERLWLHRNYRGEAPFLKAWGLSIESEEEREEGRHLVQEIMHAEDEPSGTGAGTSSPANLAATTSYSPAASSASSLLSSSSASSYSDYRSSASSAASSVTTMTQSQSYFPNNNNNNRGLASSNSSSSLNTSFNAAEKAASEEGLHIILEEDSWPRVNPGDDDDGNDNDNDNDNGNDNDNDNDNNSWEEGGSEEIPLGADQQQQQQNDIPAPLMPLNRGPRAPSAGAGASTATTTELGAGPTLPATVFSASTPREQHSRAGSDASVLHTYIKSWDHPRR